MKKNAFSVIEIILSVATIPLWFIKIFTGSGLLPDKNTGEIVEVTFYHSMFENIADSIHPVLAYISIAIALISAVTNAIALKFSDNKAVCMVGEVPQNTHKVAGFYISLPDELAGGEKSVMLSEHPFPQDTQHKMKQVTLYVEGQKTQAAGVISASLETDGKQCKVSEIPVLILSKEDYANALDKMYHGTKK